MRIGMAHGWGGERPLLLSRADRRQHLYVVGKTGTGKTTLLRNLILQDIAAGEGVGVIDPHGDLAEGLLDYIPRWRTDHVVYFDPADEAWPVAFNLLAPRTAQAKHLVASGIVGAFKGIWRDSWGPRLEYVLYAAIAALLDCQNVSLLGLPRMLVDETYRNWVLRQCTDPVVLAFWEQEFASYDRRFVSEVIAPVQNKVGQLLMAAPVRNILGQVKSKIDPRFLMDRRRIFIANLSKGRLGADKSNLLGALLVSQFELAAMSRADLPENDRADFYLYLDEFHSFSTDSFAAILSESRKYRLCLTICHQHLAQLRPELRDAVFGNAGSWAAFRVGESDAAVLAREFGARVEPSLFTGLGNSHICGKLLRDGVQDEPVLAVVERAAAPPQRRGHTIVARSRQRYACARNVVEDRIDRAMRG
ncbi:MAG TPA: type IV secretion system DNA-binding domain-containing protein [Tepidisphaeraceae bacterium]